MNSLFNVNQTDSSDKFSMMQGNATDIMHTITEIAGHPQANSTVEQPNFSDLLNVITEISDHSQTNSTIEQSNFSDLLNVITDIAGANSTVEQSNFSDLLSDPSYIVMLRIQTVLIPIVCVTGIVGNILASVLLLNPVLRNMSCCLYLAAKCICDIGFLISLFVVWLYRIRVPLLLVERVCHMTVFLSYVCGFLSVWFVVIITCENFIRISLHSKVPVFCTKRTAIITILSFVCFSVLFYSYSLWTTGLVAGSMTSLYCTSLNQFADVLLVMTYIDTVITLFFPSFIIVFLVLAIMLSAYRAAKRKQRLGAISGTRRRRKRYQTPEGKVTKFLFCLSLMFFFLHTPGHAIRIKLMVFQYFGDIHPSLIGLKLQRIFELLFYMSFSVNCLLYYIFGDNFRKVFKQTILKSWKTK